MKEQLKTKDTNQVVLNKQDDKYALTSLLLIISALVMFFFLVSGSLSDNRFGTHLVWSADLSATPMWYALLITYLAAAIVIAGVVIFILSYKRGYGIINPEQQKMLRVGAISLIGISAFYIALSSISFAVFNTNFFTETLKGTEWKSISPVWDVTGSIKEFINGMPAYSGLDSISTIWTYITENWNSVGTVGITMNIVPTTQGVVIGSLSIVSIVGLIIFVVTYVSFGWKLNDRLYFSMRNGAMMMVAAGWVIFNINLMAFGALGGDASVLVNGVLEKMGRNPLDFEKIDKILHYISLPITDNIGDWIGGLSKPGLMEGVNESANAWIILIILISFVAIVPTYTFLEYKFVKNNEQSFFWKSSAYTVTMISMVFFLLTWTSPYISYQSTNFLGEGGTYNPIIDGLIYGHINGLCPGLIGQMGQPGGIAGALVYFSPNYHGTVTWKIMLAVVIMAPFISMIISFVTVKEYRESAINLFKGKKEKIK